MGICRNENLWGKFESLDDMILIVKVVQFILTDLEKRYPQEIGRKWIFQKISTTKKEF